MTTFDSVNLGSISGVIGCTFLIVEVLKRFFSKEHWFGKIPVWVYTVVVSMLLAFIANKFLHTEDGKPLLAGDTAIVIWRAFLGAASASGFYSWVKEPMTNIGEAQPLGTPTSPKVDEERMD